LLLSVSAAGLAQASGAAMSPDQLWSILRGSPGLTQELKGIFLDRMKEQGKSVSEGDLTESLAKEQVQNDAELRSRLTQALAKRGISAGHQETAPPTGGPQARPPAPAEPQAPQASEAKRPVPYRDLQSLEDLYTQVPNGAGELKRFGIEIFHNGTGNAESLPMDLPAGPDYVLGSGDGLNIHIWGSVAQDLARIVDRSGRVDLPESGSAQVAGQTLAQAQETIRAALAGQFRNAKVEVSLTRLRTVRVYVVGDVERPGAYDISSLSTPLNALYAAGGPTVNGSLRVVKHYRGNELVREVDLYDLMLKGVRTDVERLEAGDTILVPPVGTQVAVAGMVHRPALYELKSEGDLAQAIELAGGVLVSATLRQINVERIQAHERRVMLSLNVPEGSDSSTLKNLLGSFRVQDGDRVTIAPILPYSEQTVFVEGHVFRPGKYPYRKGMQVSDLIKSYQDLLPEPAEHAELVRLVPPDYRPVTIEFKLRELLGHEDPLELQPFDTVRVFGRYEIDPPKVTINGEVLRPGEYPLAHSMTATELVRMAGGFKRSAYTGQADVASYVVQNGTKILTQHQTMEISKALAGDPTADVTLQPGDVVTIRQLSGWNDIGASVTLAGEVVHPGTYGIEEHETLSQLLKRAGGFRNTAYPQGALLERAQVRTLAEQSQKELIERIQAHGALTSFAPAPTAQEQQSLVQAMMTQQQQVLNELRSHPATGRLVIRIGPDIAKWENTAADIELRAGDVLTVPKRPSFVLINGQVYNPAAISYTPGRNAAWYLRQAGGFTDLANKRAVFVVRADGSVLSSQGQGFWRGNVLSARLQPGDTILVPEKIVGGSAAWRNLMSTAQIVSGLAIAARVATSF
jgi:protein involved in polysaccharide export with SLBB domain